MWGMKPTKSSHLANVKIKDHEKSLYMEKSAQKWCIVQMALHDVREIPSIIIVLSLLVHTDGPCAKIWRTNWIVHIYRFISWIALSYDMFHESLLLKNRDEWNSLRDFLQKETCCLHVAYTLYSSKNLHFIHPFLALKNETCIDPDSENTFNSTHIPHPSSLEEKARPFSWGWWYW